MLYDVPWGRDLKIALHPAWVLCLFISKLRTALKNRCGRVEAGVGETQHRNQAAHLPSLLQPVNPGTGFETMFT